MDYFMFFLGVFSVLFVISLALSFANYLSSVKLKNDVDSDTRNLDDRIADIFDTILANEISVENRLKDSINYNVSLIDDINNRIDRIEAKLDGIIASQKSNQ